MSFVVHPYVWSSNSFNGESSTSAGSSTVTRLSAVFLDCDFSGNSVSTHSISGLILVFFVFPVLALVLNLYSHGCCAIGGGARVSASGSDV